MIYPAVILTIAIGAVAVLLVFVIPTFQGMFASVGAALPLPTRLVIAVSDFLQGFWWMVLGGIAALVVVWRRAYATPSGRRSIDRMLLAAPVVGDLLRKSAVSRFTRTLGTLISSGVSILDGLEITAKTAGNRVVADAILASRASIAGGDTIASPLARSRAFPPMVISMIAVGEQTGGLDEMLRKIADFYDDEVDTAVSGLLALVEPVMVVALGIVVGGMVVAMYLPIFDLISTVQ
jgi:type IV pilus assembly protein PilC